MDMATTHLTDARAEFVQSANQFLALSALKAQIHAAEKELVMREKAAKHLRSMPAILNTSAIERLCDRLTELHIQALGVGDAE